MNSLRIFLCSAACLWACTSTPEPVPTEPPPESANAVAPESAKALDAPTAADEANSTPTADQLPLAEDFEDEVATAITDKNYESELDALEKELQAAR